MTEYADTMSEIEEIRAFEEGRLQALVLFSDWLHKFTCLEKSVGVLSGFRYRRRPTLHEIKAELHKRIDFTKEVIKDWTYDEEAAA
jgi:hypothetical protein